MADWNEVNSEKFLKRLNSNDEGAYAELYDAVAQPLKLFIARKYENSGVTLEDAEEIFHDAMIKVHKKVINFNSKGAAKLTTWITTVVINQARDFLRARNSQKVDGLTNLLEEERYFKKQDERMRQSNWRETNSSSSPPTVDVELSPPVSNAIVANKAMNSLNEKDQNLIRLKNVMSYEEIEEVEGTPANNLKTQYSRAKERFKSKAKVLLERKNDE